jgi:colanic acid biosynthesis glycosyl transferase WcaI
MLCESSLPETVSGLAFHLASLGKEVHAITSRQLYDDPDARLPIEEIINGVQLHRVSTTRYGRSALIGRGLDYLTFYASLWRSALSVTRRGDILVAKTDPPLLSILAMRIAQRRGAHLVNWQQDLYPEVAIALGFPLLDGPVGRALTYMRDRSLKSAALNVAVGTRMAERFVTRGVAPDRVRVIHNCNDEQITPMTHAENPLRREWGLEDKFVVGYSGNLGRAHEFNTVLDASDALPRRMAEPGDVLARAVGARGRSGVAAMAELIGSEAGADSAAGSAFCGGTESVG